MIYPYGVIIMTLKKWEIEKQELIFYATPFSKIVTVFFSGLISVIGP
jgi:hypothetical protein